MTVSEALATIPPEHCTDAVERLCADALALDDPAWALTLAGLVRQWFEQPRPGERTCRACAGPTTWLADICRECSERE